MAPEPHEDVTIALLLHRVDAFEKAMEEGFRRLDRRVESLGYVSLDRYEAEQRAIHDDLGELKSSAKWVARSLAAMVLTVVGALTILFIETRGGVG